jgi:WD40 repeat protein
VAFVLLWLGMILFMPAWSRWQQARNRANSPPGRVLVAQGDVLKAVFSPDGKRLASSGGIYKGRGKWVTGEITVWDFATGTRLLCFSGHPEGVTDLDISPDGKCLASASSNGVKVWDAATGAELLRLRKWPGEEPVRVAFDPEGKRLATLSLLAHLGRGQGSMVVQFWRLPVTLEGEKKATLFSYPFVAGSSDHCVWQMPRLAFSPDGKYLACGRDNTVLIWDFTLSRAADYTVPARVLRGHTGPVHDQAFSPDGKRLASTSDDETIRIWDPATGEELFHFDSPRDGIPGYRGIDCLAFSPDGKLLAGGKANNLAIWDAVAFSPDGKTLATGARDHEIKLWDLAALEHWSPERQEQK